MKKYAPSVPTLHLTKENFFFALEHNILSHHTAIESWFREQWRLYPPPLTCSVDIRNAGFKLSAIDANLFPAGFNNLNPTFYALAIQAFQHFITERYPNCKNILLVPENLSRNIYYYQSLAVLQTIIQQAGYDVRIGSWAINEANHLNLPNGKKLLIAPLQRTEDKLHLSDWSPCLILLNNDLSQSIPNILLDLKQPIEPSPQLGWATRSKNTHFDYYQTLCQHFAKLLSIDDWLLFPLHTYIDIENDAFDDLTEKVAILYAEIEKKYQTHHIHSSPFIIIKPDAGTYGRGVYTLRTPEEAKHLNRRQKQNLLIGKEHKKIQRILIQEGIPTVETFGTPPSPAEPVVYLFGEHVIGGFYRLHSKKKADESLNSPGMQFQHLPFCSCCNEPDIKLEPHDPNNRFYIYSVIARLSLLATCFEKKGAS